MLVGYSNNFINTGNKNKTKFLTYIVHLDYIHVFLPVSDRG